LPTQYELTEKQNIEKAGESSERIKWLEKWEFDFYWRRLINADYFKYLKRIIVDEDFL
jgi:hypothetical protein